MGKKKETENTTQYDRSINHQVLSAGPTGGCMEWPVVSQISAINHQVLSAGPTA